MLSAVPPCLPAWSRGDHRQEPPWSRNRHRWWPCTGCWTFCWHTGSSARSFRHYIQEQREAFVSNKRTFQLISNAKVTPLGLNAGEREKIAWLENHNYNPLEKNQGYALQRRRRKKKKGKKREGKEKPRCTAKRMLSSSFDKVTLVQSVTALGLNSCFSCSFCFLTHSRRE